MTFAQTTFELFLKNLSFPVPVVMAWHKPLTFGWWGKCSTTVVLTLSYRFCTFPPQFSLSWWRQPWHYSNPWPLDDETSVLPLCYTNRFCTFTLYCFLPSGSNYGLTELLILDAEVNGLQLYYQHFPTNFVLFPTVFFIPVASAMARLELFTLGWWGKCSTTVVLTLSNRFCTFPPQFSLSGWHQPWRYSNPWPLDDEKSVLQKCYTNSHCTFTLYCLLPSDSNFGLTEPFTLWCWGK